MAIAGFRALLAAAAVACVLAWPTTGRAAECDSLEGGIRLNQVGFHVEGSKLAVIAHPAETPLDWQLVDLSQRVRATGQTRVYGADPASGDHVHHADFSAFRDPGEGYRLQVGCAASHPFEIGPQPYGKLHSDALAYFYHNRSGIPIEALNAGGQAWARPAAHAGERATCRTGVDEHGNDWPGCDYSLDVSGGWYDAGDHGKYVVNGGIAVWTLLNLHELQLARGLPPAFPDGSARIPEAGNGVSDLLDEARFQLEFLLRMQAPKGAKARVPIGIAQNRAGLDFTQIDASGMAHHKIADENWTSLPMLPHEDPELRSLFPVSTAATLNLAATAAQCARIWRQIDPDFSHQCLDAAQRAYAAAQRNPEIWFIADFGGSGMYDDTHLEDEFFWAAAELWLTTGQREYGEAVRRSPYFGAVPEGEPAWPRTEAAGLVSMAVVGGPLQPDEIAALRARIVEAAGRFAAERGRSGYHIPYASDRLSWGSNSNLLNRALLLALAFEFSGRTEFRNSVIDVMDYLLGRNPLDQSYISGYGERAMSHPHHRFWAPSFDTGLPPPPPGALSGGPNNTNPADEIAKTLLAEGCAPLRCWRDDVGAYALNEVAINWNAPLVWVSAFLAEPAR